MYLTQSLLAFIGDIEIRDAIKRGCWPGVPGVPNQYILPAGRSQIAQRHIAEQALHNTLLHCGFFIATRVGADQVKDYAHAPWRHKRPAVRSSDFSELVLALFGTQEGGFLKSDYLVVVGYPFEGAPTRGPFAVYTPEEAEQLYRAAERARSGS